MSTRPAGVAAGAPVLLVVAAAAATVGVLTGAAPVIAVTVFLLTAAVVAVALGATSLRGRRVESVHLPEIVEVGTPALVRVAVSGRRMGRGWVVLATADGREVGRAVLSDRTAEVAVSWPSRGPITEVRWELRTVDPFGMTWWRRCGRIDGLDSVATVAHGATAAATSVEPVASRPDPADDHTTSHHHRRDDGDIDDLRQFHTGDPASSIAWAASLRTRRLLTHQRSAPPAGRCVVDVHDGTALTEGEFDEHLGQVRTAVRHAFATGTPAAVRPPTGDVIEFADTDAADRWIANVGPSGRPTAPTPWWRRPVHLAVADPEPRPSVAARGLAALVVAVALWALLDGIGTSPSATLLVAAALATAVTLCSATGTRTVGKPIRLLAGASFAAALFALTADLGAVATPFDLLRSALPQVLAALMVLQNFEAADRRGNRVALYMSAMVMAYAAGLRIDPGLAITVAGWAVLWVVAMYALARSGPEAPARAGLLLARGAFAGVATVVVTVGVLQFVDVPAGPARLTMPTIVDDADPVSNPGLLGGLGGAASSGNGQRAPGGQVGGYPGFSPTMDTSSRGPLGDQVVLRVRSPYPDFWRGQTFTRFDGQVWSNDELPVDLRDGNQLELYAGLGQPDLDSGVRTQQLIQTYYLETDVPNLVFAAPVADLLVIDARAGQRPDGTILTDVTLPAGTVYSVVSHRAPVTSERLRAVGDVADAFAGATAQQVPELELPASTSDRTLALARELAAGSPSTYDTVRRIEAWLAANVAYDLDAPVPEPGQDAVDHFLFESRLGFCEQIASATTILLRSLGVPARVATGYVPSDRDDFTGMWISRASDAHAWVEVYFPGLGWQGFDPTAAVPLAGESSSSSIGGGLVRAAFDGIGAHIGEVLVTTAALSALAAMLLGAVWATRRVRRGRWGRLQDRFVTLAVQRGADPTSDNASLAAAWRDHEAFVAARAVADELDASVFDPTWHDDDDRYRRARASIDSLPSRGSRQGTARRLTRTSR